MTENAAYRSSLVLMNGSSFPITVRWERFAPDGSSLGTDSRTLTPWSNTQVNRVFSDAAPVVAAYVDVWTDTPGGRLAACGSVLDAVTSDPTTMLPQ